MKYLKKNVHPQEKKVLPSVELVQVVKGQLDGQVLLIFMV